MRPLSVRLLLILLVVIIGMLLLSRLATGAAGACNTGASVVIYDWSF